jgi:hypothetical protein
MLGYAKSLTVSSTESKQNSLRMEEDTFFRYTFIRDRPREAEL